MKILSLTFIIIQEERHGGFLSFYLKRRALFTTSRHPLMLIDSIIAARIGKEEKARNLFGFHIVQQSVEERFTDTFASCAGRDGEERDFSRIMVSAFCSQFLVDMIDTFKSLHHFPPFL